MNTDIIRKVGIYLGAAFIGGALGYFVGELVVYQIEKRKLEEQFEQVEMADEVEKPVKSQDAVDAALAEAFKQDRKNYRAFSEKKALDELVKPYKAEEAEESNMAGPRVLTDEQYAELDVNGLDTICMTYYMEDNTLAWDENEQPIPEFKQLIGDALDHFGEAGRNDPDEIFVLNRSEGAVYDITRSKGSYQQIVMGIIPEKPKRTGTKRTRKKGQDDEH